MQIVCIVSGVLLIGRLLLFIVGIVEDNSVYTAVGAIGLPITLVITFCIATGIMDGGDLGGSGW